MPNIQFDAKPDYWIKYRNLTKERRRGINDILRKTLYRELNKLPDKKK